MSVSTSVLRLFIGIRRYSIYRLLTLTRRLQYGRDGGARSPAIYAARRHPATLVRDYEC